MTFAIFLVFENYFERKEGKYNVDLTEATSKFNSDL